MTARRRVTLYFREDGLSLSTNDLTTIEAALRFCRFAVTSQIEAPLDVERKRTIIACEELQASLSILWPGQDAVSKLARLTVYEALFGVRSWSAIEALPAGIVETAVAVLHRCETEVERLKIVPPQARAAVIAFISTIRDGGVIEYAEHQAGLPA